jgi:hypothetical protein
MQRDITTSSLNDGAHWVGITRSRQWWTVSTAGSRLDENMV